jgi:peptidoglycan/LPS O-acetylase OafA/YrhL
MSANRNLKLYFPNLNGLRFIAAFYVIIDHTEQLKGLYRLVGAIISDFSKYIGKLGMMLFFVLSGVLIRYLLVAKDCLFGFIPNIVQILPIGTKEQSYLIGPVLLKKFQKHNLLIMIGIVVSHFSIRILFSNKLMLPIPYRDIINKFWIYFNIDSIIIGSILAVLILNKDNIVKYILHINFFYTLIFITITLLIIGIRVPYFHYQFYSFLFGINIVNLVVNSNLKNVLERKAINYLSKIYYGIYRDHFLVLIPILIFVSNFKLDNNSIIYFLIFSITIAILSLSYHFFEFFFLKIKAKFAFIKSVKI